MYRYSFLCIWIHWKIRMLSAIFLLSLIYTGTFSASTAQKRVIDNYLSSLETIKLDDPQWITILDKIATKTDTKATCLYFKNSKWLLPLKRENLREKRKSTFKSRPFFLNLAKNITKRAFPRVTEVISDIFSNQTSLGNSTADQIEASRNIILLSSMQKLSEYSEIIQKYQPVLIGISVSILSIAMCLLLTCLAANSVHDLISYIYRRQSDTVYCSRKLGRQRGNGWSK